MTPAYYLLAARHPNGEPIQPMHITGLLGCHCLGSVIDYVLRAGRKPGQSFEIDLDKAGAWLDELERLLKLGLAPRVDLEARDRQGFSRAERVCALRDAVRAADPGVRSDCLWWLIELWLCPIGQVRLDCARDYIALLRLDLRAGGGS